MTKKEEFNLSKFLSLILRHKPERIDLKLDENGWAEVDDLIQKANTKGFKFDTEKLNTIVENNNKKRFAFNEDKSKIRANQGHSISVDLQFQAEKPPKILYHGTGEKYVQSIEKSGLIKKNRNHVHLSADIKTALIVGKRHGNPKIFIVDAEKMNQNGFEFYLSKNGVWLIDSVPSEYLSIIEEN